ncbi:MAG: carbon monoxide dehydrogenase subunit G, partial [Pseudomonadota bacterium]|nr:carbon monoxide dehydrogenase subunit G [Pseudomonadota bacterium]
MQQQGVYEVPASVELVWAALNNPAVLQRCVPGCQSMQQLDDANFAAAVKAKVGPVNATFQVQLAITESDPPNNYVLQGEVKGGAGVAKGAANVQLSEVCANVTSLSYSVDASVGGKLAQVGSRLVDAAARKMADEFFANFCAALAADEVGDAKANKEVAGMNEDESKTE